MAAYLTLIVVSWSGRDALARRMLGPVVGVCLLSNLVVAVRGWLRERWLAGARRWPVDRPVVGIHPHDRGDRFYTPRPDGSMEIELRLRGHRYTALFTADETDAYRRVLVGVTETLNDGADTVDVNRAFAEALGREPFVYRGPLPETPADRLLRRIRRKFVQRRTRGRA